MWMYCSDMAGVVYESSECVLCIRPWVPLNAAQSHHGVVRSYWIETIIVKLYNDQDAC